MPGVACSGCAARVWLASVPGLPAVVEGPAPLPLQRMWRPPLCSVLARARRMVRVVPGLPTRHREGVGRRLLKGWATFEEKRCFEKPEGTHKAQW